MPSKNNKTVCLNMIVKNESHIITETLDNINKYIDYWVICDTGSTDGTQDLIRNYFKKKGIPGEIVQHEWKNFGHNRSLALKACKGKADYIFIMDADDVIVGDFKLPTNMIHDSYRLKYGDGFTYYRDQIFGNHLDWRYVGILHEYPECTNKTNPSVKLIEGDYYVDSRRLGDRSKDPKKYLKDAEALVKGIEEEKERDPGLAGRYAFYAGQSYIDYGDYENGIKYYKLRIKMGGWFEETYYSYYKVAQATESIGKSDDDIESAYLDAHNFLPSRAEPLYELARYFRVKGNYQKGYKYAAEAIKIPFPKDQTLFIYKETYDWKILDEFALCAYYVGKYQESFDVCQKLLNGRYLPDDQRLRIEINRDFCVPYLKDALTKYNPFIVNKIKNHIKRNKRHLITFSITTCKRFDLFEKTINSFLNCCQDVLQIDRWICVDDNSSSEDRNKMQKLYPFFEFVFKGVDEKGHPESMNIIIKKVVSPFLVHTEDDWHFFERKNYIKPAIQILKENPELGQVCFNRNYSEILDDKECPGGIVKHTRSGQRFLIHEHYDPDSAEYRDFCQRHMNKPSNCYWPHYSLRPSVINTKIFQKIGDYNENTNHFEMEYAHRYVKAGLKTAFYDAISCLHTGRLTSERDDKTKKNAYELNDEVQFGDRKPKKRRNRRKKNNNPDNTTIVMPPSSNEPNNGGGEESDDDLIKEVVHPDEDSIDYDKILERAKDNAVQDIPFGLREVNESKTVKDAISDIVANVDSDKRLQTPSRRRPLGEEDNKLLTKGKEFEGYTFYPHKDSMGNDIKYVADKTVEELKELCDQDPDCLGFNTLGYFKHTICDESEFISLPSYDGKLHGLYVSNVHWKRKIQTIKDKILNKKESITVVLKHFDDFEEFKTQMERFLFYCRDVELVKTWICINYDVDEENEEKIKQEFPFFHFVIRKMDEEESLDDIREILGMNETKYVFSLDDDICRRYFSLKEGMKQLVDGNGRFGKRWYFNDVDEDNKRGPFLEGVETVDLMKF